MIEEEKGTRGHCESVDCIPNIEGSIAVDEPMVDSSSSLQHSKKDLIFVIVIS